MFHYFINGTDFELDWSVAHVLINAGCFVCTADVWVLNAEHMWTADEVAMILTGEL